MMTALKDLDLSASPLKHLVTLRCGQLLVAVELGDVQEINRQNVFCEVPEASWCVRGVMNLRGEVITMIDLRAALHQEKAPDAAKTQNVFVLSDGEVIGLVTDGVSDIVQIPESKIMPPPTNVKGVDQSLFRGVYTVEGDELVVILDLDHVLKHMSKSIPANNVTDVSE